MKTKSKHRIICGIVAIALIGLVAAIAIFIADTYTIPVANAASLSQVNGGDDAFVTMRTTNKIVEVSQNIILPVCMVLCLLVVVFVGGNLFNLEEC